ncbi:MAG: L-aspartate oxidase, partial [Actinomycetota bacterium]|nr:L-aspartate oxidase [Actinomycetota bacterium]
VPDGRKAGPKSWQTTNLLHLGQVLTHHAALREETRGGHVRGDFPGRDDEHWRGHLLSVRRPDGTVETTFEATADQHLDLPPA